MKKFINDAVNVVPEALRGFGRAHRGLVAVHEKPAYVTRAPPKPVKVALISGGGSGHEPLHVGFVGHGMLDAACPGQVFTSPTPDQICAAAEAVDTGRGVLFIVKNYSGDVMNFEMAAESFAGKSASILVQDDVAVESSIGSASRRGVAGTLVVEKIVGAAAEAGADLPACAARGAYPPAPAPAWGARSPAAPFRPPASRPSSSTRRRWSWASASMASRAAAACPSRRRTSSRPS
jgi:dihydroxyacetone kinase-like protein